MSEILDIVDDNDNVIGQNTRKECRENKTLHRVVCVILKNSSWKILLQKRSESCNMPWYWDISAGGHVSTEQDYEEAAKREMLEEIWVQCDLTFISKKLRKKPWDHYYFSGLYECQYDGEICLTDGEVEKTRFFTQKEIQEYMDSWQKMTPRLLEILQETYL